MIREIDIWRAATLMLKRYGERALEESASRADEFASAGDDNGMAVWRRISDAVGQSLTRPRPAQSTDRSTPFTGKQPYAIGLKGGGLMAMAGLWETWRLWEAEQEPAQYYGN